MDLVKEAQKKRLSSMKKKKALHGWFVEDFCGTNKYYSQFDKKEYVIVSCATKHKVNPFPPCFNITYVGARVRAHAWTTGRSLLYTDPNINLPMP